MTQQSLVTRLKAVEEALEMFTDKVRHTINGANESCFIIGMREQVSYEQMRAAVDSLSDLRELIKEADGQKSIARICGEKLYTALGEKP